FFFQAEDGIRDSSVTGVQTCALPISTRRRPGIPPAPSSACRVPDRWRNRRSKLLSVHQNFSSRGRGARCPLTRIPTGRRRGRKRSEERRVGKESKCGRTECL